MFLSAHKTPPFLHTLHRFANSRNLRRNMFCRFAPGTLRLLLPRLHLRLGKRHRRRSRLGLRAPWGRDVEEQPGSFILEGVDVTGYPIFSDPKVQKGIAFAKKSSPWPISENRRPLSNSLYPYRKNLSNVGSIKWQTSC
ncbi:hypothetical protein SLA2020_423280 [Shorea laevis]